MADDSATVAFESSGRRAPATVVVRVDHTAFTRGHTEPARSARSSASARSRSRSSSSSPNDAIFKALITDGTDVLAVSHLSRTIPARMRTAVEEL